jgi:hypothetical protein
LNLKKILRLMAAVAAIAAAAIVCLVASAFALHAFALQYTSPAGAAAVVALVFALIAGVIALLASRKSSPGSGRHAAVQEPPPLTDRLIQLARERPLVAGAAAIAATVFVARNPKIMNMVLSAALATKAARTPTRK